MALPGHKKQGKGQHRFQNGYHHRYFQRLDMSYQESCQQVLNHQLFLGPNPSIYPVIQTCYDTAANMEILRQMKQQIELMLLKLILYMQLCLSKVLYCISTQYPLLSMVDSGLVSQGIRIWNMGCLSSRPYFCLDAGTRQNRGNSGLWQLP